MASTDKFRKIFSGRMTSRVTAILLCAFITTGGFTKASAEDEVTSAHNEMIEHARAQARPGDVLFKSGAGFWGRMAKRFSEEDKSFGHVGVVVNDEKGDIAIVHAGGNPLSPAGKVQKSEYDEFLRASEEVALYRPKTDGEGIEKLIAYLTNKMNLNAPFDKDFSLVTDDELYCTELVWRALSAAVGEDAVPEKTKRAGRLYIAIDDLQASPWLEPVWREKEKVAPQK
jgi:hypothetical protein